jgi:hypothetical protein
MTRLPAVSGGVSKVVARFYHHFRYTTDCLEQPQQVRGNVKQSQPKKQSQANQWSIKSGSRAIWIVDGQIGLGADRLAGRKGKTLLTGLVTAQSRAAWLAEESA